MRTLEEINADVKQAINISGVDTLLRLADELDELATPEAEAMSNNLRGTASRLQSSYPSALEHYQKAVGLYEGLEDRRGVASVTGSKVACLLEMNRLAEAVTILDHADSMTIEVPSYRMESTGEEGRIHMSANMNVILSQAKDFNVTPRDTIDIKGKGAMKTFWLERA